MRRREELGSGSVAHASPLLCYWTPWILPWIFFCLFLPFSIFYVNITGQTLQEHSSHLINKTIFGFFAWRNYERSSEHRWQPWSRQSASLILCWSLQLSNINFDCSNFRRRAFSALAKSGLSLQMELTAIMTHSFVDMKSRDCPLVSGRDEGFSDHGASFQGVCRFMAQNCVARWKHRLNTCR